MVSTYRLMSQVLLDSNKKFSNEELAIKYQENQEPSVLAEIFCRNFPEWVHMVNRPQFYNISNDDKVSIVLEKLNKALLYFDVTRGIKFTTYANKLIAMELYNKRGSLHRKGRDSIKCVQVVSSSEIEGCVGSNELVEDTVSTLQFNESEYEMIELKSSIYKSNMTEREKQMCMIILDNPGITDIEISELMKVHRHTVRNIRLGMKNKVLAVCT